MYEIMLANSVNATSRVKSLDRPYFSFCQIEHLRVVVENQESESPSEYLVLWYVIATVSSKVIFAQEQYV